VEAFSISRSPAVAAEVSAASRDLSCSDVSDVESTAMFEERCSDAGIDAERADCFRRSFLISARW
jgi:hypothetical protein